MHVGNMMLVEASTRGVFEGGYEECLRVEVHVGQSQKIPSEGVGRAARHGIHKTAFDPRREQEAGVMLTYLYHICVIFVSYSYHICVLFV